MRKWGLAFMMLGLLGVVTCGSSSSTPASEDTGPSITTLADLPGATSPMATTGLASISRPNKSLLKAAATGLNLYSTSAANFNSNSSRAACEVFNVLKEGIKAAGQSDMILCYIQNMQDQLLSSGVDVYDGEYHTFDLNFEGGGEGPDKVKFRIAKENGSISEFKMFMCRQGSQFEFASEAISGSSFAMASKGISQSGGYEGIREISATGTLNADRVFTAKEISVLNYGLSGDWGWNRNFALINQVPGEFSIQGYQVGGGEWGTHQNEVFGAGEMLGDTSESVRDLAMGDGSVKLDSLYTPDDDQMQPWDPEIEYISWLGDSVVDLDDPTAGLFYEVAQAGEFSDSFSLEAVEAGIAASYSFADDESWDCSDEALGTLTVNQAALAAQCSNVSLEDEGGGSDWINCYDIIEQQ